MAGRDHAARREVARVDAATADIANARIALSCHWRPKAQAAVEKLRDTTDPGLLFDWARALRMADHDKDAHAMLLRISRRAWSGITPRAGGRR